MTAPSLIGDVAGQLRIEWELAADGKTRTGRWRRGQYWGVVGDTRTPAERPKCPWREGQVRR